MSRGLLFSDTVYVILNSVVSKPKFTSFLPNAVGIAGEHYGFPTVNILIRSRDIRN